MNSDDITKLTGDYYAQLVAQIEQGKPEQLIAYFKALALFWEYSYGNVCLIIHQRPDATKVAGFQTWRKLDRFVKKGEKGIGIIVPWTWKPKDGEVDANGDIKKRTIFKVGHVFDVSQTDGAPLPTAGIEDAKGEPGAFLDGLKRAVAAAKIELDYKDGLGGAKGVSKKGAISLLAGMPPAEEFSVLTHEYGHEILHQNERRKEKAPTKKIRETEAETVSYIVSSVIGLQPIGSPNYIMLYDGDVETLKASFHDIQATSKRILTEIHLPTIEGNGTRDSLDLSVAKHSAEQQQTKGIHECVRSN